MRAQRAGTELKYISTKGERLSTVLTRLWRQPTMRDALKSPNLLKLMMSSLTEPCVFLSPGSLATTTSRMSPDNPDRLAAADSRYLEDRKYFKH